MKQIAIIIGLLMVLSSLAYAQTEQVVFNVTNSDIDTSQIKVLPTDSVKFWFANTMPENLDLFFTFNKEQKALKQVDIANKRALEYDKCVQINDENCATLSLQAMQIAENKVQIESQSLSNIQNANVLRVMQKHQAIVQKLQERVNLQVQQTAGTNQDVLKNNIQGLSQAIQSQNTIINQMSNKLNLTNTQINKIIELRKAGFSEDVIQIQQGDVVAFLNNDQIERKISGGGIQSTLLIGQEVKQQFNEVGSYTIVDGWNPKITMQIIVTPKPTGFQTTLRGSKVLVVNS